jgi:hypothetical protein
MGTQARLPGTLPTPAAAKASLRMAREEWRRATSAKDGLTSRLAAARDEAKAAAIELGEAEADLLAAEDGGIEELDADERHAKAVKRFERAEADIVKVRGTIREASRELKAAQAVLTGARAEMQAIRQGRRKVKK